MWMHRARIQFQKLEEPLYEAKALMQIGTLHRRSTDLEKATQSWLAAIAVLDSIGVDSLHDAIYMDLASVMFDLDDVAGFETYARKAIPIARKYGHQRTLATSYMARQDVARRQGQLDSAAYFAQQAQSIASEMGNAQLQAYALLNQGIVAEARERLNLAIGFYQQAAAMPGLSPYDRNTFRSYLAQALNTSNRHPEALPVWQKCLLRHSKQEQHCRSRLRPRV
jgi:tetratricopeptide (TPR) repeat protein